MGKVRLLSSKKKHDDGFLRITFDRAVDREGNKVGRLVVHHPGSAVIMPVNDKREVLLEHIFRVPAVGYLWELPAGRMDEGETPLQAAKRELIEETGLRARSWRKLAEFWASPGFLAEKMTIYLAENLRQGEMDRGHDEHMKLRWFTRAELERMLAAGRIHDAKTLIGLRTWLQETGTAKPKQRLGG